MVLRVKYSESVIEIGEIMESIACHSKKSIDKYGNAHFNSNNIRK